MNPVFKAAAESSEHGWLMGLMTLFFFAIYMAWVYWAWAPWNKKNMEDASLLPFEDGGDL